MLVKSVWYLIYLQGSTQFQLPQREELYSLVPNTKNGFLVSKYGLFTIFYKLVYFWKIPSAVNWERASGFFSDKFIIRVDRFRNFDEQNSILTKNFLPLPMQCHDPHWKTNLKYENGLCLKLQIPIANCLYKVISINNLFQNSYGSLMKVGVMP